MINVLLIFMQSSCLSIYGDYSLSSDLKKCLLEAVFCAETYFPLLLYVVHEAVQLDVVEAALGGGEQHKQLVATTNNYNSKYRCT